LVTLKKKFGELLKLGYELISTKCKHDDLGRRENVKLRNALDVVKCKWLEGTTKVEYKLSESSICICTFCK